MPRRNANHVHDTSRRPKRHKSGPQRTAPIDWSEHSARIDPIGGPRLETRRSSSPISNNFMRYIVGFSPRAFDMLLASGLENVDERGFIPVRFSGVTQHPGREMDYKKASLIRTRGAEIILSGLVDGPNQAEIGNGEAPIRQVGAPILDSHDSSKRLNVTLGQEREALDIDGISRIIAAECTLGLTKVMEINGSSRGLGIIHPYMSRYWQALELPKQ